MVGRVVRIALDWEVDIIDPPCSFGGWNTGRVVQQVFESLVEDDLGRELGDVTSLVPSLARSYTVSLDGLKYRFVLREGVTFHDGTPLDASAIASNVDRLWNRASPYFRERAFDYNRMAVEHLESLVIHDSHTVEFVLKEPFAEFLRYMTQEDSPGSLCFVSPDFIKSGKEEPAPGTGAYAFHSRFDTAGGSGVMLRRYDGYWGPRPPTEYLKFLPIPDATARAEALLKGDVELAYSPSPDSLEDLEKRGFVISERPVPYVWYLALNLRKPPLDDARVRRALMHGINRSRLSSALFGEATAPVSGIMPPASPSYEREFPEIYPYDTEKARSLLREAGYENGFCFEVSVARAGSGQLEPVAIVEHVASDLAKIGVEVRTEVSEDWVSYCEQWHQGMGHGLCASEMSWGMSCDIWLDQVLHSRNMSPLGFNTGYYTCAEVDALLDRARRELDPLRRRALYQAAHRLVMVDVPIIPLLTINRGLVVHSPRIRGFRSPAQNWHTFAGVWLDE